jgi:hypothetical protein
MNVLQNGYSIYIGQSFFEGYLKLAKAVSSLGKQPGEWKASDT